MNPFSPAPTTLPSASLSLEEREVAFAHDRQWKRVRRGDLRTVQDVPILTMLPKEEALPLLIKALGHSKPTVREAAGKTLRGYGEPAFHALLTTLTTGSDWQRKMAAECLGGWGDRRAVEPLLDALQQAQKEGKKPSGRGVVLFYFLGLLSFLMLCFPRTRAVFLRDTTNLQLRVLEALAKLEDVQAVGLVAQLARSSNVDVSWGACKALFRLLPLVEGMPPQQADRLGAEAIPGLAALLTVQNDDLTKYVLTALHWVGDGRAIPAVEKLTQNRRRSETLRDAATRLLPILTERAAQEQQRLTLLRGAEALPATPSDQLLRPAHGEARSADAPQQLLRAAFAPTEGRLSEDP